jgi:hypothetical protein
MLATTVPCAGSTLWMRRSAICQRNSPSKAVPASAATGMLAHHVAVRGIERDEALAAREPDVRAIEGHAADLGHAGIGPYSRRISAAWACFVVSSWPRLPNRQRTGE